MSERVLLVDVDSKISNLALMKLARYHAGRGDEVRLYDHRPSGRNLRKNVPLDLVGWAEVAHVSCVFAWNAPTARRLGAALQSGRTDYGGQGLGVFLPTGEPVEFVKLPPEVDSLLPDYSIYPGEDYAVGFCNRGCFRKCGFCSVPKLEGKIRPDRFMPPSIWVPDGQSHAFLLDNEFAAYPPAVQREIVEWFRDAGVRYCISQGLDLRILARNPSLALPFADYQPCNTHFSDGHAVYCAWDNVEDEDEILAGIAALTLAGISPRNIRCYILIGYNTTRLGDLHRFRKLAEIGVRPFAMIFNKRRDDPWLSHFARFCNLPALRKLDWFDYEWAGFRAADYPISPIYRGEIP